ncbi:MAG: ErfK/YbiS/YcfS/YnhG family protein [Thermoleophilia bacterium]|nr:ErfK/YbiS/YcfS/YnhG family protein [Thermoleophilia bacterium]
MRTSPMPQHSSTHRLPAARYALLLAALIVLVTAAFAAPTASAAELALRPVGGFGPLGNERLSNERTVTRYGSARFQTPIYRFPGSTSRKIASLRFSTEDGFPEIYLVLRSYVDPTSGQVWLQIRVPGRPNGRTGWVPQTRMGDLRTVDTFLHIERGRRATLRKGTKIIWQAPIGSGARSTPTPAGNYYIREKFRGSGGIYGPYVFGTSAYSVLSEWPRGGVIGIHGTNQPGLIPGSPSHGCVRVRNAAITKLFHLMPVGTPLLIT